MDNITCAEIKDVFNVAPTDEDVTPLPTPNVLDITLYGWKHD